MMNSNSNQNFPPTQNGRPVRRRRRQRNQKSRANQQARGINMRPSQRSTARGGRRNRARGNRRFPRSYPDVNPSYMLGNSGVTTIRHSEAILNWSDYYADVNGDLSKTFLFPVAPRDLFPNNNQSLVAPWLNAVSSAWDQFRLDSLVFRYMGSNSVIGPGAITWAIHTDVADEVSDEPTQLLALTRAGQHALRDSAWQIAVPLERVWRKVADGLQTTDTGVLRQYAANVFYIRVDGFGTPSDPHYEAPTGTLRVEYTISLSNPIPYVEPSDGFATAEDTYEHAHYDILDCIALDTQLLESKDFTDNWAVRKEDLVALGVAQNTELVALKSGTYTIDFGREYLAEPGGYGVNMAFEGTMLIDDNNYVVSDPVGDSHGQGTFLRGCLNKLIWIAKKGYRFYVRAVELIDQAHAVVGVLAPLIGVATADHFDRKWKTLNPKVHRLMKTGSWRVVSHDHMAEIEIWNDPTKLETTHAVNWNTNQRDVETMNVNEVMFERKHVGTSKSPARK